MKRFRGSGWICSLLLGGVLAIPHIAVAGTPTMTIDGVSVNLTSITCTDTGYNSCWSIPGTAGTGTQIGQWMVADVSTTNKARVLINDVSTVGSIDAMKLTGVTFKPVVTSGTKQTAIVITNVFNAGGGNPTGDYIWAMGVGGYFKPPLSENVVGDRLQSAATGNFGNLGTNVAMGTIDTGVFTTATLNGVSTSITKSIPASTVEPACDMGGGLCFPTITYTFTITVAGQDQLVLNDSAIYAGGTCRETEPPPSVPPGTPDTLPVGPVCKGFQSQVNQVIHHDELDSIKSAKAAGAVVAQTCTTACGTGTITINKQVSESPDGTFGFDTTGEDLQAFSLTTPGSTATQVFNNVSTGPLAGSRTITETVFPTVPVGLVWILDSVTCTNTGGENTTSWSELRDIENILIGVTISNVADNDSLTCTFVNTLLSL